METLISLLAHSIVSKTGPLWNQKQQDQSGETMINLTPHNVVIRSFRRDGDEGYSDLTIPSAGKASVITIETPIEDHPLFIPVVQRKYGEVVGLPPPVKKCKICGETKATDTHGAMYNLSLSDDGHIGGQGPCGDSHDFLPVTYIVSSMVRDALGQSRPDVFAPDTGPTAIRNEKGQVEAVTRLIGVNIKAMG